MDPPFVSLDWQRLTWFVLNQKINQTWKKLKRRKTSFMRKFGCPLGEPFPGWPPRVPVGSRSYHRTPMTSCLPSTTQVPDNMLVTGKFLTRSYGPIRRGLPSLSQKSLLLRSKGPFHHSALWTRKAQTFLIGLKLRASRTFRVPWSVVRQTVVQIWSRAKLADWRGEWPGGGTTAHVSSHHAHTRIKHRLTENSQLWQ